MTAGSVVGSKTAPAVSRRPARVSAGPSLSAASTGVPVASASTIVMPNVSRTLAWVSTSCSCSSVDTWSGPTGGAG